MLELIDYKNFFNKTQEERLAIQKKQSAFIWEEDKKVASYLGTSETYLVAIIHKVIQLHDYAQHKVIRNQPLTEEEKILLEHPSIIKTQADNASRVSTQEENELIKLEPIPMDFTTIQALELLKEDDISMKVNKKTETESTRDLNVVQKCSNESKTEAVYMETSPTVPIIITNNNSSNIEKEPQSNSRKRNFTKQEETSYTLVEVPKLAKSILIEEECGVLDYGLLEKLEKRTSCETKDKIIQNNKKSKHHEDIYNSFWAPRNKINSTNQLVNPVYYFTMWDLPRNTNATRIKSYLSFFGTATVEAWQQNFKTKAAYIKIIPNSEQREKSLKESWSIHLEHGKTFRTTPGKFDITELEGRNQYRTVISNIPTTAYDSLLLRQLKKYKVQAVHILSNSNGNQRKKAHVYFKSEEDLLLAQSCSPFYFNTKLVWHQHSENPYRRNLSNNPFIYKKDQKKLNKGKRSFNESELQRKEKDIRGKSNSRSRSITKKPLRSIGNECATGPNKIKVNVEKRKQKKHKRETENLNQFEEANRVHKNETDSSSYKIKLEQIIERLDRIEKKHLGADASNYS